MVLREKVLKWYMPTRTNFLYETTDLKCTILPAKTILATNYININCREIANFQRVFYLKYLLLVYGIPVQTTKNTQSFFYTLGINLDSASKPTNSLYILKTMLCYFIPILLG